MTALTMDRKEDNSPALAHSEDDRKDPCFCLKRINKILISGFYNFGYQVGLRPLYFIIIPLILSAVLSTGLFFIEYVENPIVLFVPFDAPFIKEQKIVEAHFPPNDTDLYDPLRLTGQDGYARLIISAKDKGSIFRSVLWPDIMELDEQIRNLTIPDENGQELNYEDLCSKWRGNCVYNFALNLNEIVGSIENGSNFLTYPINLFPILMPQVLGGVVINKTAGTIDDAKAITIAYFPMTGTEEYLKLSKEWELKLIEFLKKVEFENIEIGFLSSRSLGDELNVKMNSCIPYIPLTGFIMVTACMGLLWMSDCVRGKPLIGVIGIVSATISAGASFGFLLYLKTVYTRLNVVALFLVLGIGVDDIFVAISAWQKTSLKDPVPKRLAQTYADAAVSVTITSLTNALAFAVGTSTPTVIVESFCLYSCVTIIFAYIWFITFCGGFLALGGYMEEQGRHALFLVKVKEAPAQISRLKKKFYYLICTSASKGINTEKKEETHTHVVSAFFRDHVGTLLCNKVFRVCVLLSYIAYLIGAIYGMTILKEGLYRHRMSRDDSYLADFFRKDALFFRQLPYNIQVVITGNITYSDKETQQKLLALERKFEALPNGADSFYTQSWLRSFLRRLRRKRDWQQEITDEASFIKVLREKYLGINPDNRLILDVEFNEDYTRILASRILFQAANVKDIYADIGMMKSYRKVAEESEFNVTTYHLLYSLFDQHSMMKPLAIQSLLIAIITVMIVALLFIPDMRGSFAIAFSIVSIAVGVMGYMAYWNVNLDHVSVGSIFMCIGFSVDFSAHITYTYLSSKETTSEAKIRHSVHSLGWPILQGGFTTVLCLVTFLLIPGYGYRTFFKTILMVTLFAAYHSIILIPLFLAQLEDTRIFCHKKKSANLRDSRLSNGAITYGGITNGVNPNGTFTNRSLTNGVISNGSLKHLPNGHSKTDSENVDSQNNNENETTVAMSEEKFENERNEKVSNVSRNGEVIKMENGYPSNKDTDDNKGAINKAFTLDEKD